MTPDRIEKQIEIAAPVSRVWRAITDHREFGEWFQAKLDGPFVVGQVSHGRITYPGYEHLAWEAVVQKIEPERYFSFSWTTYCGEPGTEALKDIYTLVEFLLEPTATGTLLRVVESGFDRLPAELRDSVWRRNEGGWSEQVKSVDAYVRARR